MSSRSIIYDRTAGAIFLLLIAAGSIFGIITPKGIGLSFSSFYDAGHRVLAGDWANLYTPAAKIDGEDPLGLITFRGTPISAYLTVPLAWFEPLEALIVLKTFLTACLWLALGILYMI